MKKVRVLIEDIREYGWKWNLEFLWRRFQSWAWGYYHVWWLHKGKYHWLQSCRHTNPYGTLWNDLQDLRSTELSDLP